ncbi:hypothetical protein [Halorubrum aquaticum]|nr:hypothetical protein [Halorubrum aquaticum]
MTDNGSGRDAVATGTTSRRRKTMEVERSQVDRMPDQLTVHVGGEDALWERAQRCTQPIELIVSPVELHQRNLQRRLREANLPKNAFSFEDPVGISNQILDQTRGSTTTIDRIDRLSLLRSFFDGSTPDEEMEVSLPPGISSRAPQQIEQIRTEVETITNFHPQRVAAWRNTATEIYHPIDEEAEVFLETALAVERQLRERTTKAVSETGLIRRATRSLVRTDGSVWEEAYPDIQRVSLLGLSSLSAPHTDLVHALCATTPVEVHVHFRSGTGEYLQSRVESLLDITNPGTEVFE